MTLERIWIKRMRRGPMDVRDSARLIPGKGIEGNANQGGRRQVTVLSADRWDEVEQQLGETIDPRARRANLFVRGVELEESRDRVLRVGSCRILIHGETVPCGRMNEAHADLQEALRPAWGGGAYGEVLSGGTIAVGDPVAWETSGAPTDDGE